MNEKIKVGVSSCLLGKRVRYDGQHKLDMFLRDTLSDYIDWVPVCPEVECGLSVPREAMHLIGELENPHLVTIRSNTDYTEKMLSWIYKKLDELEKQDLVGFVFKSKSPSSGLYNIKIYSKNGIPEKKGIGLFANAFSKRFPLIPVEDDGRLHDPVLRENFIERIFVYHKWRSLMKNKIEAKTLINFHTENKYLIMAHSPKHLTILGRLVAQMNKKNILETRDQYSIQLMEGLKLRASKKRNTNVLFHLMGYVHEYLSPEERQELNEIVELYHKSLIPLIVPITLIKHYVKKYNVSYLLKQTYLNPHPIELMLRNHV